MALTFDTDNLVINSDSSITDLPAFHADLRGFEDNESGVVSPVTHTYKKVDIGGGAYFHAVDLINGWVLKFIGTGPFQINGNLRGSIVDTGVQVERTTSAAFSTTAVGGSGPSAESIAAAVIAALQSASPMIPVNAVQGAWPTAAENADAVWSKELP